ncbi:hypothetical protein D3C86_1619870 [compost metagenome]
MGAAIYRITETRATATANRRASLRKFPSPGSAASRRKTSEKTRPTGAFWILEQIRNSTAIKNSVSPFVVGFSCPASLRPRANVSSIDTIDTGSPKSELK